MQKKFGILRQKDLTSYILSKQHFPQDTYITEVLPSVPNFLSTLIILQSQTVRNVDIQIGRLGRKQW
jgi:hypothetical protein